MNSSFKNSEYWALILGGSSGIGLATAKKLASMGLNLFIVHRDRKGSMSKINSHFDEIKSSGVKLEALNINALEAEGREKVLQKIIEVSGKKSIRVLLHSIALGNLKLAAPEPETNNNQESLSKLAESLDIPADKLQNQIDQLFNQGVEGLDQLATPVKYDSQNLIGDEDVSQTIYNMGTSILSWVQDLHLKGLFSEDTRIFGLTSEGNEISWKGYAAVSAAKCALESIVRTIAREYAPFGIRANIIQPGITDTPALRLIPGSQHMKASAVKRNPFKRLTTPEDVANLIGILSLDEASWVNGSLIRVDGGEHISG